MPKRNRLTNSTDETEIANLISGDNVFTIPYFQRAYKWKTERLKQLEKDILSIVDSEGEETHFLGAVIIHGRRSNPSEPDVHDVIDGQQRITTVFVYLCAIVKTLCELDEMGEAAGLFQKYLVIGRDTSLPSNVKLHSCKDDRAQLNFVFADLLMNEKFKEKLGNFKLKPLPTTGEDRGTLRNNYRSALRFLKDQVEQGGVDRVRAIYKAILDSMSVVQIDVWDPTNGPKIFDSLNSRQEPMTIGDLVRNEIFSKVANEHPDTIEQIDATHWQPFYHTFHQNGQNLFDAYFFPYGLIQDSNLKKSEVYGSLKKAWQHTKDPAEIIKELATYQNAFIDIESGTNLQQHSKSVATVFKNLHSAGAPSSTYPFLMQLSNALKQETISVKDGLEVLAIIESFLVRRSICGHEPTGLHAVFKKLWDDCNGKPTKKSVTDRIREHKTVAWPGAEDLKREIQRRPLYGSGITKYLLLENDRSLGGDQPTNVPWIEHILPEKPVAEWFQDFTREEHESLKDLLANLIPLSMEMNIGLSNDRYEVKKESYENDSMFKSARKLAQAHSSWTPAAVAKRGQQLAEWAATRWAF